MIIKNYEIGKVNFLEKNFTLVYGLNEGHKKEVIKKITEKIKSDSVNKYEEKEIILDAVNESVVAAAHKLMKTDPSYKDLECQQKYFSEEEFSFLSKQELNDLLLKYIDSTKHLSIDNIKYLAINNIFIMYYNLLGRDNLYTFFNKPVYQHSYYQVFSTLTGK